MRPPSTSRTMSETKALFESHTRSVSNGSIGTGATSNNNNNNNNNNVQDTSDANGNRRSPVSFLENTDSLKSRSSILDSLDRRSPRDLYEHRRNSTHGLDLSKTLIPSPRDSSNGLDLTKPEHNSTNTYSRPSDLMPIPLGIPSDTQPAPASVSYGPGRSDSAGEAVSPFRADSVPSGYSPDNLSSGGGYKSKFQESYGKSADSTPPRFQEGFATEAFEPITTSPGLNTSAAESPTYATKLNESFLANKLSENAPFPKPQDTYSKILEDFSNNARNNNNNNISGSKLNKDFVSIPGKLPDSPYRKIAESYTKEIETLANGFKPEPSIFKQENCLSPGAFKSEPSPIGTVVKSETTIPNGGTYVSKPDNASSSPSQSSNQSLPSIFNFSTNHFRGISAAESGLASYLNSFGVGGAGAERSENKSGSGRDGQSGGNGGGSGGGDSSMSRSSPNNKLACRFCGKTFSQAGYIKAHERLHTGEKPFACSVCGKRFSDPSNWKKHERVHANNKKQSHLLDSHESKVKNLFIKSMSSLMSSSLHQRLAVRPDPGGPITCKICGKVFSSQSSLSTHKRIHTGERPYRCSSCGKCFTQIGTLRTHERIHTGEKPYICKVCGRTFAQSGSYRMHERRHMTDSVQRCHICYATFTTWQDLQRHMASHPQVTQAIIEFEEGNQGLIDRLNSGDLGGQLGDGGMGQLGHSDSDGQVHGPSILTGDCGSQRDLGVHHGRCPQPLIPESLLLESEAAAFHAQAPGLYHTPGQLPPFSSILPFRHHPGGPPTFSPSFPPGLGLLGHQSLPVTSHAELLSKHPIFGVMISSQMKHDALSKLSPTYSSQHPQLQPHHLIHQQQHPSHHIDQQQQLLEHGAGDGTDVVSTTSASKRAELEQRIANRSYTPEERSDTGAMANGKEDKDASAFARSVSSDEGSHSPEDRHMEINGDEEMIHQDHEMAENDNDDDTDIDERNYPNERDYSDNRRFSQNGERSIAEKERDRDRDFGNRHRSRSYEGESDKEKRSYSKERNPSGGSGSSDKNSNGNNDRDIDFDVHNRDRNYDNERMFNSLHNGRSSSTRTSINRHDQSSSNQTSSKEKRLTKSLSSIFAFTKNINSGDNSGSINNTDHTDLRPPKRHIERQNLNTRMIPSSSSRKQRHPMRRFSSAGSEQESPQSTSSLPVSSTTVEAIERGDIDDNDLVTFLLTKGRVHKCVHCHMIFEDASLFLLHNGFHSHDDPFKCVVCSTLCKDRVDFNCHLTSHIK